MGALIGTPSLCVPLHWARGFGREKVTVQGLTQVLPG